MSNGDPLSAAQLPSDFLPELPHLVGVSGGRDSMALLHWLISKGFRDLSICHIDHGLRSNSSEDASFTQDRAMQMGVKAITRSADAREFARAQNLSLEAAAREVRYRAFATISEEHAIPRLILAHHADDQVETFLLQLLRGAGAAGLGGMAPSSNRYIEGSSLRVARPFLGVWRAEIDEYIAQHNLPFREDPTNSELVHTRNRIRHLALPALKEAFGRDPRVPLWRAAELLRAEDELISAAPELQNIPREMDVSWLSSFPLGMQRRIIHKWLRNAGVPGAGFEETEAVRSLLFASRAKVNLPVGYCARRRQKRLFIDRQQKPE